MQRARDSNPRYRKVQRFSRPPRSTTPPALCLSYNSWSSQEFISFNRLEKQLSSIRLRLSLEIFKVVHFPRSFFFRISNPAFVMNNQTLIKIFRMSIVIWTILNTLQDICLIHYNKETNFIVSQKFLLALSPRFQKGSLWGDLPIVIGITSPLFETECKNSSSKCSGKINKRKI